LSMNIVFSFFSDILNEHMGDTHQGKYLIHYLANFDAKTCVLEEKYVDKDYMIDYRKV
jgi:hypothetical protein